MSIGITENKKNSLWDLIPTYAVRLVSATFWVRSDLGGMMMPWFVPTTFKVHSDQRVVTLTN